MGVVIDMCSLFQDFFQTYVALSDWIKALWLIVPSVSVLASLWIVLNRPRT